MTKPLSTLAGVVARRRTEPVEVVESVPPTRRRAARGLRAVTSSREREAGVGLFESLLSQIIGG